MLRQMQDRDWPTVKPWIFSIAEESFDKVIPGILERKIQEDYKKEPEGFVVSEDDKRALNGLLWFSTFPEKKSAFVHAIYVEPAYRGKGISDELLEYLENYCRDHKLDTIELNVTVGLDSAIRFYQRKGFDIKRYFMSKKL